MLVSGIQAPAPLVKDDLTVPGDRRARSPASKCRRLGPSVRLPGSEVLILPEMKLVLFYFALDFP